MAERSVTRGLIPNTATQPNNGIKKTGKNKPERLLDSAVQRPVDSMATDVPETMAKVWGARQTSLDRKSWVDALCALVLCKWQIEQVRERVIVWVCVCHIRGRGLGQKLCSCRGIVGFRIVAKSVFQCGGIGCPSNRLRTCRMVGHRSEVIVVRARLGCVEDVAHTLRVLLNGLAGLLAAAATGCGDCHDGSLSPRSCGTID